MYRRLVNNKIRFPMDCREICVDKSFRWYSGIESGGPVATCSVSRLQFEEREFAYAEAVSELANLGSAIPEGDFSNAVAKRFGGGSLASDRPASSGSALGASDDSAPVSVPSSAFFSLSLASRPSTRLRSASKTSVFGPRFFGTASAQRTG